MAGPGRHIGIQVPGSSCPLPTLLRVHLTPYSSPFQGSCFTARDGSGRAAAPAAGKQNLEIPPDICVSLSTARISAESSLQRRRRNTDFRSGTSPSPVGFMLGKRREWILGDQLPEGVCTTVINRVSKGPGSVALRSELSRSTGVSARCECERTHAHPRRFA